MEQFDAVEFYITCNPPLGPVAVERILQYLRLEPISVSYSILRHWASMGALFLIYFRQTLLKFSTNQTFPGLK